jgi:4-hydroxythreonine-4-phosphate dehydrogenase
MGGQALLPIALTMGDPAGIGPEITMKAWQALRNEPDFSFFVIADPQFYSNFEKIDAPADAIKTFNSALPILPIECKPVKAGHPDSATAPAITGSIEKAVDLIIKDQASAVVTNPISKDVLYSAGFKHPGHTEYLASLTHDIETPYSRGPVMMLSAPDLRVALATIHTPLNTVPGEITIDKIMNVTSVLNGALKIDLGIKNPRIAMAGLNPHAGENGALGKEEQEILNPAAQTLRDQGVDVTDAQSADTLFHAEARKGYDAVLAMYHDQGLIPVKTLDFHGGINTTLGLPIVRTSPDHGTAFAIAGQNIARPDSLIAAIKAARQMADNRAQIDG